MTGLLVMLAMADPQLDGVKTLDARTPARHDGT